MIKRINLDKSGLEMFVGPFEAQILSVLWDSDKPLSTNAISGQLVRVLNKEVSSSSITTTLERMTHKGLLQRIDGTPNMYLPICASENVFITICVDYVIDTLARDYRTFIQRATQHD